MLVSAAVITTGLMRIIESLFYQDFIISRFHAIFDPTLVNLSSFFLLFHFNLPFVYKNMALLICHESCRCCKVPCGFKRKEDSCKAKTQKLLEEEEIFCWYDKLNRQ